MMLKNGAIDLYVVILPGFPGKISGSPTVDIYYSNSQFSSLSAIPVVTQTAENMGASASKQQNAPTAATASQGGDVLTSPSYAATGNYTTFLVAGLIVMTVATTTMFSGGFSIITDKISGNFKSFVVSPINKHSIAFSKILSGITQALFSLIITVLIGIAFGAQIAMGVYGVIWIFIIGTILALGFGAMTMVLTSKVKKVEVYAIAVQAIVFPLWFLAGAFFPTSELPSWLYPISVVNPLTYATNALRDVMLNGYFQPSAIALNIGIISLFSVAMLLLSFTVFKQTIE